MLSYSTAVREPPSLGGRNVLVVEDEYFLADDISRSFKAWGAHVLGPVGYIREALDLLEANRTIDAAILDINIGSEMVFPLARTLRARRIPFVFTTGYERTIVEPEFRDIPLWEKPIDMFVLGRALAGMISTADAPKA
jgi:CheY-like chemotaxis protein